MTNIIEAGTVLDWNPVVKVGTILKDGGRMERYFFYASRILRGPDPHIGSRVLFEVKPKEVKPEQLPIAYRIEVIPDTMMESGITALGKESHDATPSKAGA